jgi:hypothetical protein
VVKSWLLDRVAGIACLSGSGEDADFQVLHTSSIAWNNQAAVGL